MLEQFQWQDFCKTPLFIDLNKTLIVNKKIWYQDNDEGLFSSCEFARWLAASLAKKMNFILSILADWVADTHCVKVHVDSIALIDFKHSVSISEAALVCRTPRLHHSDLKSLAALVCSQVEAKALSLQPLQLTESGHYAEIWLCAQKLVESFTQ